MRTKFHKSVEWLRPFLESADSLVPIDRIKWVKGFSVARGKKSKADAYVHRFGNNKTFHITLETEYRKRGKLISPYLYNFSRFICPRDSTPNSLETHTRTFQAQEPNTY
jgi:hypothetical protein